MLARASNILLPAVLAALLALLAAFQLFVGGDNPFPASFGRVIMPRIQSRAPPKVTIDPVLARASIFTPVRSKALGGVSASLGPLGDAVPVGVTRGRGFVRVVLQCADGRVLTVPVGGAYRGWRVAAVAGDGVRFIGTGGSVLIPLAARALSAAQSGTLRSDTR